MVAFGWPIQILGHAVSYWRTVFNSMTCGAYVQLYPGWERKTSPLRQKASPKKQRSNGISPLLPGFVPSPRYFRQTYCRTGQAAVPQPAVVGTLPEAPTFM